MTTATSEIASITTHLQEVANGLASLTATLQTEYKGPLTTRSKAHLPVRRHTQPKALTPKVVEAPKLHNPRAAQLVAKYAPKPVKAQKAKGKAPNRLSPESIADIKWLLLHSEVPVGEISEAFSVSRAAIYGLRDRLKLSVRKGSPELMAGIRRAKAKRTKPAAETPAPAQAPTVTQEAARAA